MHKYFEKKPPKVRRQDEESGDESLDAFADKIIEDKMKELNRGAGLNENSDDDEISDGQEEGEGELDDEDFYGDE